MDAEFEVGVVLSIIYDARLRNYVVDILKPEYFGVWENRYLFKKIQKLEQKQETVNFVSLYFLVKDDQTIEKEQKENLLSILFQYKEDPNNPNLISLRDGIEPKLLEETKKTILKKGVAKLIDCSENDEIDEAFDIMNMVQREAVFNKPEKISFDELISNEFSEHLTEWGRVIPTGIRGQDWYDRELILDNVFDIDGLPTGSLMLISGVSGGGKSTLALNIGIYLALRGYNVDFYSLELPLDQLSLRSKSILTGFPSWQISKKLDPKEVDARIKDIKNNFPDYKPLEIVKVPPNTMSVAQIERNLYDSEKRGRHVDCLITDYLDLMKPPKKYTERRFELDGIGYGLKEAGQEYGCANITITQNNRTVEHKNIINRFSLSGSFEKINYANTYITINEANAEIEDPDGEKVMAGKPFLWIDKNTFGKSEFYIFVDFDKQTGRFWDVTKGD